MEIRDTKNGDNKIILTFSLAQHGLSKYRTDTHVVAFKKKLIHWGLRWKPRNLTNRLQIVTYFSCTGKHILRSTEFNSFIQRSRSMQNV